MRKQTRRRINVFVMLLLCVFVWGKAKTETYATGQTQTGRPIGAIEASYLGESVQVGQNYRESDVQVMAYYQDDVEREEGFLVTPIYGGTLVTRQGENVFKLMYLDPVTNKLLETRITVTGHLASEGIVVAKYLGGSVAVGQAFDPAKVVVEFIQADGSTLRIQDYTVDKDIVTKIGDNAFTVSFQIGKEKKTGTFIVPGYWAIGDIEAVYTGGDVIVGQEYRIEDVRVTAYYADDVKKVHGVTVIPEYGDRRVRQEGGNVFVLTYRDLNTGIIWKPQIVVNGRVKMIQRISATYVGDPVEVGNSIDQEQVQIVALYEDGTSGKLGGSQYQIGDTKVHAIGDNLCTVTVIQGETKQEAQFTVKGIEKKAENQPGTGVGNTSSGGTSTNGGNGTGSGTPGNGTPADGNSLPGNGPGNGNQIVQTGDTVLIVVVLLGSLLGVSGTVITLFRQIERMRRRAGRRYREQEQQVEYEAG